MAEQMWRVVAVFRVVTLAYAAVLIIRDHGDYAHPAAGWLALAVMAVWIGDHHRRLLPATRPADLADLPPTSRWPRRWC